MTIEYVRGQSGETGWTGDKPMFHVSLSERFADHLVDCLRGLTLDLASVLMQRGALNFGLAERRAAGGATELVLGEGVNIAALDRQLRAALGVAGFKLPERYGGTHEGSPSSDWDEVRRQRETETVVFSGNREGVTGGSPVSADYINRVQGEIMQMISGGCASRHPQSVPARARCRAVHFWAVCLLLPAGAALLLHAMGRRSSRKSR